MAGSRVTQEAPKQPPSRPANRSGYNPGAGSQSGTFASGFNNFLATGRVSLALALAIRYGIDREYIPRFLGVLTADAIFSPMRFWQSVAYGRRIKHATLHPEPLFLLGFWRSGTTLLHNLLAVDQRWGYINTYQAAMPDLFLAGQRRVRRLLESKLPENRGIDNIPVDFAMPQEEEIAMMCTCGLSPYVFLHFPRTAAKMLDYLFVGDRLDNSQSRRWRRKYLQLLRAASYNMGGKPLLLKSPSNTSRVSTLLELFPNARFVYIQRNPYDTLRSYIHLLRLMNDWHAFQRVEFNDLLKRQVLTYRQMALTYLEQRELIPDGRLVEIKYEDLELDKLGQIHTIYGRLGLEGFESFKPQLEEYVDSIAGFQKNPSHIDDQVIELVNEHVPFLVTQYGYNRLSPHLTRTHF
jgi:hypothetical protein